MAEQAAADAGLEGQGDELEETGGVSWLDWAGGAAAVLLVIIVADIFSDGRLVSAPLRRWFARREGGQGDLPSGGPGGN